MQRGVVCLLPEDDVVPWTAALPGADLGGPMQGAALVATPLDERLRTLRWSPRRGTRGCGRCAGCLTVGQEVTDAALVAAPRDKRPRTLR